MNDMNDLLLYAFLLALSLMIVSTINENLVTSLVGMGAAIAVIATRFWK
jgi:hypothetical protein